MDWTTLHGPLLSRAIERILGETPSGSIAFVRCLTPDVVEALAIDRSFAPNGWQTLRVAKEELIDVRTIAADRAVEMREAKGEAVLLLVDTELAGAGMDSIYSAAREVDEPTLFHETHRLLGNEITRRHSAGVRRYAENAIKRARGHGERYAVSRWTEFDFLCRVAEGSNSPGALLHLLGLWPIQDTAEAIESVDLNVSRMFVERLLGPTASSLPPATRIESIRLDQPTDSEIDNLERFLHSVDTKPILVALEKLSENEDLWIGSLRTEQRSQTIQGIELVSWRNQSGRLARWSGLSETSDTDDIPAFVLRPDAEQSGRFSTLEVRWRVEPPNLEKNAAEYRVIVQTDQGEELAAQELAHSARKGGEKVRFSNDDFSLLDEDALVPARVTVEVIGAAAMDREVSEDFVVRFGEPPEQEIGSVGTKIRTMCEGLAELSDREVASDTASRQSSLMTIDPKGFVLLRTLDQRGRRKSFKVFRPSLISEVEKQWCENDGEIGRWIVNVRGSGERAGGARYEPIAGDESEEWVRAVSASRAFAQRFMEVGGVGQVYDERANGFRVVQEYLRAWTTLLERGDPRFSLGNTVEVRSLAEHTIGIIVLPAHPIRVAWHTAYDNLVLHTAFVEGRSAKEIRDEFGCLDGAMFPTFLPNPNGGAFVFSDTLGFHALGMVPDSDKEPKAALTMLARALGDDGVVADYSPTMGGQSSNVLANEIVKYLQCHDISRLLHIHALRAGDGMTVARALGDVHNRFGRTDETGDEENGEMSTVTAPVFSLDLYPSVEQRHVAGRFISDAREKRRSGAGVLASEDRWMLESQSLPGEVTMPRLRWSRKERRDPNTAAHLAIAFDTFESQVIVNDNESVHSTVPHHVFGLLSFYERSFVNLPSPAWESVTPYASDGEKHPSRRVHSEALWRMQDALNHATVRHYGKSRGRPVLRTEISREKADSLAELHKICDWVVTLDRNAGIEFFDSPHANRAIYDAYVIDCVPEREDLGCLQLITSTTNLTEVRNLLDGALDQMGLSRSRRNAEFLLEHLKALSGRLAIRLTGNKPPTSELIALALSHVYCDQAQSDENCWVSLKGGFIVPVDDVQDLLPRLTRHAGDYITGARPDLIYVSLEPRRGLSFRFIEVKYRRHLRNARSADLLQQINAQTGTLRERWNQWFGQDEACAAFRAVRRAKLARMLRFYADKAERHGLPQKRHQELIAEINRMIEKGGEYSFGRNVQRDLGWIFCPEYSNHQPLRISADSADTQIFLFGPSLLPDSSANGEVNISFDITEQNPSHTETGSTSVVPKDESGEEDDTSTTRVVASRSTTNTKVASSVSIRLGTDVLTSEGLDWQLRMDGNPHLLIAGQPGMGKTTSLVSICKQMVNSEVLPIVFSYHQDIDERLKESIGRIRFVDFDGLGFNPLRVTNRDSSVAHLDVAGAIRDIFTAIFPELGDIQADRIRKAIKTSFEEVGWTSGETGASEPPFRRFLDILHSEPNPDRAMRTLLARFDELDDYGFFDEVGDTQESLWDGSKATVIRIHSTQNDNLQRAFAYLIFYGMYKDMFRRGVQNRITHSIIFDEAHRASRLKLVPTMAKECRKYGVSLVLASQEARDFDASVFSAIANYLILRCTDTDAKFLIRNVSNSKQERALIDRIKQMGRFRALYFGESMSRPSHVALSKLS